MTYLVKLLFALLASVFGGLSWAGQPPVLPEIDQLDGHPIHYVLEPDTIRAIDKPRLVDAEEARFLSRDDLVLGVAIDGQARAYPLKRLHWHEVVNDQLADCPIAVTW